MSKRITALLLAVSILFSFPSISFAKGNDTDELLRLIDRISGIDIADDTAMLGNDNQIETAYSLYDTLSPQEKTDFPAEKKALLDSYVLRLQEILSGGKLRSATPRAIPSYKVILPKDVSQRKVWIYEANGGTHQDGGGGGSHNSMSLKQTFNGEQVTEIPYPVQMQRLLNGQSCGCSSNGIWFRETTSYGGFAYPSSRAGAHCQLYIKELLSSVSVVSHFNKCNLNTNNGGGVITPWNMKENTVYVATMGWVEWISSNSAYPQFKGYRVEINFEIEPLDTTPPTTPTIYKSPASDWSGGTVTATIGGSTDIGGSGVNRYQYQINGGGWVDYSAPLTFEYSAVLEARAVDNAGLISSATSSQINIDKTAPTTPTIYKSPATPWSSGNVTTSIGGSTDIGSGLNRYEYQLNGGAWQVYTAPFAVASTTAINARTIDNVGLISPIASAQINIDKTAPTIPIIYTSPATPWSSGNVTITIAGSTDIGSGLNRYEYQLNSGAWQVYTAPFVVSATTTVNARAIDNVGLTSPTASRQIRIDKDAPSVPHISITLKQLLGSYSGGWYSGDVLVTIDGSTDNDSGLKGYLYQLGGGAWQNYGVPFVVSNTIMVSAYSLDNAGNPSPNTSAQVRIDRNPPTIPIITKSPATEYSGGDVTFTLSGSSDGESGLKGYQYQLDGGAWQDYTAPVTVTTSAELTARSLDNVDNPSPITTEQIKIDRIPPTMVVVTKSPDTEYSGGDVTFTLSGSSDIGSGLKGYQYQLDGGGWIDYTAPVVVTASAELTTRSLDNVDNPSPVVTDQIKIDRTPPTMPVITKSPATEYSGGDVTFTLSGGMDSGSGLKGYQYQLDGGAWIDYTAPVVVKASAELTARSLDIVDNHSPIVTEQIKIDRTAPSKAVITKTPNKPWHNDNVTFQIGGGVDLESGVKGYRYQLDGGEWQDYTGAIEVSASTTIKAVTVNHAGLSSLISEDKANIDRTPPTVPSIFKDPDTWTKDTVRITVNGIDEESGIQSITANATTGSAITIIQPTSPTVTTGSAIFAVPKNGTYSFLAKNHAGSSTMVDVTVDNIEDVLPTPPKENISDEDGNAIPPIDPDVPDRVEKDWTNTVINLEIISDAPSGIARYEYRDIATTPSAIGFRGRSSLSIEEQWKPFDGNLKLEEEGIKTMLVRSVSNAGNISIPSSYIIKVDYTVPDVSHEVVEGQFIITATDALSGVKSIVCDHGEVLGQTVTCPVSPSHEYLVSDNAGNGVAYSIVRKSEGGGSSGGGNDHDDEVITKPVPSPSVPPVIPLPPAVPKDTKPIIENNSSSSGISENGKDGGEDGGIPWTELETAKPVKDKEQGEDAGVKPYEGNKGILCWFFLFLFLLLLIILIILYIRKKLREKEDDSENVW